jgi:hypothetical protein
MISTAFTVTYGASGSIAGGAFAAGAAIALSEPAGAVDESEAPGWRKQGWLVLAGKGAQLDVRLFHAPPRCSVFSLRSTIITTDFPGNRS